MFTVREKLNAELLFTQISCIMIVSFIHVKSINFCENSLCAICIPGTIHYCSNRFAIFTYLSQPSHSAMDSDSLPFSQRVLEYNYVDSYSGQPSMAKTHILTGP